VAVLPPPAAVPAPGGDLAAASASAAAAGLPALDLAAGEIPSPSPYTKLRAVVSVDPSLSRDADPPVQVPTDQPDRMFPLDLEENLVGRRSDAKRIYPEVDVADPGVSHRHCHLLRQPDSSFVVVELGSANGTQLNGRDLEPGVPMPIRAGDQLTLGMWTRIAFQSRIQG
jgi:hypothetical protein